MKLGPEPELYHYQIETKFSLGCFSTQAFASPRNCEGHKRPGRWKLPTGRAERCFESFDSSRTFSNFPSGSRRTGSSANLSRTWTRWPWRTRWRRRTRRRRFLNSKLALPLDHSCFWGRRSFSQFQKHFKSSFWTNIFPHKKYKLKNIGTGFLYNFHAKYGTHKMFEIDTL